MTMNEYDWPVHDAMWLLPQGATIGGNATCSYGTGYYDGACRVRLDVDTYPLHNESQMTLTVYEHMIYV